MNMLATLRSRLNRRLMLWAAHRNGHKVMPQAVYSQLIRIEDQLAQLLCVTGTINDGTSRPAHVGRHARRKLRRISKEFSEAAINIFHCNLNHEHDGVV
jgi:hypothetical protein